MNTYSSFILTFAISYCLALSAIMIVWEIRDTIQRNKIKHERSLSMDEIEALMKQSFPKQSPIDVFYTMRKI